MNTRARSTGFRALSLLFIAAMTACEATVPTGVETDPIPARFPERFDASVFEAGSVVLFWGEACLQSIRETVQGPPMSARTLAMVHTAMYDAWVAYDAVAVGTRLEGSLRRPAEERTLANKEAAISHAAFRTLVDLFPAREHVFRSLMHSRGYDPDDPTTDPASPVAVGNAAAAALLVFRHQDGSNQLNGYADYSGYEPVNGPLDPTHPGITGLVDPSRWQPLIHDGRVQSWIIPHWRNVTPFALESADQFMPPPPAPVQSGEFRRQVQEVVNTQANLTDRQKVIAEFWADGPSSEFPPGHWCTIAQYVSLQRGLTLDEDVKLFFVVANAVFDASIAAWSAKLHYDYVRPVSAVRFLKAGQKVRGWAGPGQGTAVIEGDAWVPYQLATFRTPPFAEYVSGHSTFSAAGATVLRQFLGNDTFGACATIPAGSSSVEPGSVPAHAVTLCWPTFSAAAEEAGISRLYGGIHFRQANEEGLLLGRHVGGAVWRKAQTYFDGSGGAIIGQAGPRRHLPRGS
jgi:membrane-associated phospholipid phosphatase